MYFIPFFFLKKEKGLGSEIKCPSLPIVCVAMSKSLTSVLYED